MCPPLTLHKRNFQCYKLLLCATEGGQWPWNTFCFCWLLVNKTLLCVSVSYLLQASRSQQNSRPASQAGSNHFKICSQCLVWLWVLWMPDCQWQLELELGTGRWGLVKPASLAGSDHYAIPCGALVGCGSQGLRLAWLRLPATWTGTQVAGSWFFKKKYSLPRHDVIE